MQFFPCLICGCYKYFWVKALKLFPSLQGAETDILCYIHFYSQQWNKSFWTQILSSGTLNVNINDEGIGTSLQCNNTNWREILCFFQLELGMHLHCVQTQDRNQSHSGTHHCSFYNATPTPSTAAAIDAEASSRVLLFWTVLKTSRMSPSSQSSKSSNPSPHSRPAFTCSQGIEKECVFSPKIQWHGEATPWYSTQKK